MDDELCAVIEPLLPVKPAGTPRPPQLDSRRVLQGILFGLITGIGWEDLPQALGFGSGMTYWRRLRDRQAAGAFERIHQAVLARAHAARLNDVDRVMADGSHVRAKKRGAATGPSPVDRAETGSEHHILTCANGFPLAVALSAAMSTITWYYPHCSTGSGPCAVGRSGPATGSPP
ncbi:transposase [Nocardia sp. alder85J]|nr:transposase [Nocardia sp. alder85J]